MIIFQIRAKVKGDITIELILQHVHLELTLVNTASPLVIVVDVPLALPLGQNVP